MFIKEVCALCNLTKKAIEYYENQGLIRPEIQENGYRVYRDAQIERLMEISVLRHCGLGIPEIREIMDSEDRTSTLERFRHRSALRLQRMQVQQRRLDALLRAYDIPRAFEEVKGESDCAYTLREKLVLAFPGGYGIMLSLHFGRFLDLRMETPEQRTAYANLIAYLDEVPARIPDALAEYMEETFRALPCDSEKLFSDQQSAMRDMMADPEAYFRENPIEEYLQYRLSDAFRESPAGRMAELMAQFQRASGYREVFLENMKRLSPAYRAYLAQLEAANARFLERYPQAARLADGGE